MHDDAALMALFSSDYRFIKLLELSPFERQRGGWRFGTKRIADSVVDRLAASGRATIDGERVQLVKSKADQRRCSSRPFSSSPSRCLR